MTYRRSARWRRSSSAGWTPRSTAGSIRSARRPPTRCAAGPPSPTRGSPTSYTSRGSPVIAGRRCGRAAHGELRGDAIHGTYADARQVIDDLEALGVGYDDVVGVLEDEGVQKFAASWQELLTTIESELAAKSK